MNQEMGRSVLSVLMPNYNHSKYIGEALTAILEQSYKPDEIIIIDDASTDESIGIIRKFVEQNPIVRLIVNKKNLGVVHNLNKLLELAKGDYVYFAAADDKILPGFFEKSMNLLQKYPSAGLCSALSLIIDEESRNRGLHPSLIISGKECFLLPEQASSILRKKGPWMMGNAAILKRKALIDSGGYIPELHSFSDGFIYQVVALKHGACFVPEPLVCWRKMGYGYAMSTGADPKLTKELTKTAMHLMQTTYNNLFSKEYINDFEKVQYFLMNLSILSPMRKKKTDSRGPNPFSFVMSVISGIKRIYYILYLFIRFRPNVRPIITRKFNRFFHLLKFHASRKISVS